MHMQKTSCSCSSDQTIATRVSTCTRVREFERMRGGGDAPLWRHGHGVARTARSMATYAIWPWPYGVVVPALYSASLRFLPASACARVVALWPLAPARPKILIIMNHGYLWMRSRASVRPRRARGRVSIEFDTYACNKWTQASAAGVSEKHALRIL